MARPTVQDLQCYSSLRMLDSCTCVHGTSPFSIAPASRSQLMTSIYPLYLFECPPYEHRLCPLILPFPSNPAASRFICLPLYTVERWPSLEFEYQVFIPTIVVEQPPPDSPLPHYSPLKASSVGACALTSHWLRGIAGGVGM